MVTNSVGETASLKVEAVLNIKFIIVLGALISVVGCKDVTPEPSYFVIKNPVQNPPTNSAGVASPSPAPINPPAPTDREQELVLPPARNLDGSPGIPSASRPPSDIELTQRVRQALVRERGSFSTAPGNIDVFTQNGQVTLRGPIERETDRREIERIAGQVNGIGQINNQLQLQPR
jgi:hypothetical protein